MPKRLPLILGCLAAAAAVAVGVAGARAQEATTTAYIAGIETSRSAVPEIVLFNTTSTQIDIDLVLRGPTGAVVLDREEPLVLAPDAILLVSLQEEIAAVTPPRTKPYEGLLAAELTGDATQFDDDRVIVHATQYYGSRKKPKAAFVVRPLFAPLD